MKKITFGFIFLFLFCCRIEAETLFSSAGPFINPFIQDQTEKVQRPLLPFQNAQVIDLGNSFPIEVWADHHNDELFIHSATTSRFIMDTQNRSSAELAALIAKDVSEAVQKLYPKITFPEWPTNKEDETRKCDDVKDTDIGNLVCQTRIVITDPYSYDVVYKTGYFTKPLSTAMSWRHVGLDLQSWAWSWQQVPLSKFESSLIPLLKSNIDLSRNHTTDPERGFAYVLRIEKISQPYTGSND